MTKNAIVKLKQKMPDFSKIMEKMSGADPNSTDVKYSHIIYEKYTKYQKEVKSIYHRTQEVESILRQHNATLELLPEFIRYLRTMYTQYLSHDFSYLDSYLDIRSAPVGQLLDLKRKYFEFLNSPTLLVIIKMIINIGKSNVNKLSYMQFVSGCCSNTIFIPLLNNIDEVKRNEKIEYQQYTFTDLNEVFNSSEIFSKMKQENRSAIRTHLIRMYRSGKILKQLKGSPDIDTADMFQGLMELIKHLKKDVGKCDGAFKVIEDSYDIFERNFNKYYKEMIYSGDPTSLITAFVEDILQSDTQGLNMSSISQLKKIVSKVKNKTIPNMKARTNREMPAELTGFLDTIDEYFELFDNQNEEEPDPEKASELMGKFNDMFL